jgi:2-phosphoglycerate kinase
MEDHRTKIIVIAGGSFQGKSLIAQEIAADYRFSGVITTDMVRNILRVLFPEKPYLSTSTYLMPEDDLTRQCQDVSDLLMALVPIYQSRGEHIIIEGMHFSDDWLSLCAREKFCNIVINNLLPFEERIIKKQITRAKLRMKADSDPQAMILDDPKDVYLTRYHVYQERIDQIHQDLVARCQAFGFHLVEFNKLEDATHIVKNTIDEWL